MPETDEQLMLAFAAGDAGAFDRLYARHRGTVFRFVSRSLPSRADAEEVFQEVWMKAIEARHRYEPRAKFTTWLYAIAHNHLVDTWRKKGLTLVPLDGGGEDDPAFDPPSDPGDEPFAQVATREAMARFVAAFEALPPAQREAFVMKEEAGLSIAEIAAATGTGEEAVKSRVRYATAKLREALDG
ncbi:MAG: sigma-70 family RNA polymerase sigma factor [Betaproteobacteria bacterium]|nr:sigma-70 family RNA polymerase sigma factor [Betaproteobacteria bacterium]